MKKVSLLLALALVAALLTPAALATQKCGDAITWSFNSTTKTLTLTGYGPMYNYASQKSPWYANYNTKIYTIVVGSGITSIGDYAFQDIRANVSLPDTVEVIGAHAFEHNYDGISINLPARLTTIGESAFSNCRRVAFDVLPAGVTSIGKDAFSYCWAMQTLTLPEGLTRIEDYTFYCCYNLTSVTLPQSLTFLGKNAFGRCTVLEHLSLPANLASIGTGAFSYGCALADIQVEEGNAQYQSVDGVLFDASQSTLVCYPGGKPGETYTVPESVNQIGYYAFSGSSFLEHIILPEGVTVISACAFAGSPSELYGFQPSRLTRVDIPESVTEIGSDAFSGVTKDLTIRLVAGSWINGFALENGYQIEYLSPFGHADLILPADLTTLEESAFEGIDAAIVIVPEGVKAIGSRAFASCPNLKHVRVPDSVASLASDAFAGCGTVYLYGPKGGAAQDYSKDHGGAEFIPLNP